jgi:hypothetical protein
MDNLFSSGNKYAIAWKPHSIAFVKIPVQIGGEREHNGVVNLWRARPLTLINKESHK